MYFPFWTIYRSCPPHNWILLALFGWSFCFCPHKNCFSMVIFFYRLKATQRNAKLAALGVYCEFEPPVHSLSLFMFNIGTLFYLIVRYFFLSFILPVLTVSNIPVLIDSVLNTLYFYDYLGDVNMFLFNMYDI